MPALKKTEFEGRVTFLGHVADRTDSLRSASVQSAMLDFDGIADEVHGGATRASCSRVTSQYAKGTEIRNVRQLSVLSAEELAWIANKIGVAALDPALVGASMVIEGIPEFTHVPPSSRLQFASGASITVDMENRPCVLPAPEIEQDHAGHGKAFKAAAQGRRGVTAWVECPGAVSVGDTVVLHVPDQPVWSHLNTARGIMI